MHDALSRAYGTKAQEKGLSQEKDRIVTVATSLAVKFGFFIEAARQINPCVTFSFEHPWGALSQKAWYKDLKALGLRETWVSQP